MKIIGVDNLAELEKLAAQGFITLHSHTGKMVEWYGQKIRAWYIDEAAKMVFSYDGRDYIVKHLDGCFFPYVFRRSI